MELATAILRAIKVAYPNKNSFHTEIPGTNTLYRFGSFTLDKDRLIIANINYRKKEVVLNISGTSYPFIVVNWELGTVIEVGN